MSSPERIAKLVRTTLQHADASYPDQAHRIWEVWRQAVGEDVARRTQPLNFYRGRLTVGVSTAPWLQQLQLLSEQMMETLNQKLEAKTVTSIRFRVAHLEPATLSKSDPGTPWESLHLPRKEAKKIETSTVAVKDSELRQAIRDAQTMAKRREHFMQAPTGDTPPANTPLRSADHEEPGEK